jgi:DNA mismatch endonuclease (patch repair protein)
MNMELPTSKNPIPFKASNRFVTTLERSQHMAKIKSKDTKAELILRKALFKLGLRYRKNDCRFPGKPDIVFSTQKLIIFIDGAFWHGYNWDLKKHKIKTNRDFWIPKIEGNIERDRYINVILSQSGWTVLRFWDHQVMKELDSCLTRILQHINK